MDFPDHIKAIEIKATKQPSQKDIRNLKDFAQATKKETKLYLFYLGATYLDLDGVKCLPIASIYRAR